MTKRGIRLLLTICAVGIAGAIGIASWADTPMTAADYTAHPQQMVDAYRHVEAASVSDAMEQLLHQKRYMSHRMQAIFPTKFAGTAVTVLLKPEENRRSGRAHRHAQGDRQRWKRLRLRHDGEGWGRYCRHGRTDGDSDGGARLCRSRGGWRRTRYSAIEAGAVSGVCAWACAFHFCRALPLRRGEISRSCATESRSIPGISSSLTRTESSWFPKAHAADILIKAQALDNSEHSMYPFIEKYRSIVEAVQKFGRI